MDSSLLRTILEAVRDQQIPIEQAIEQVGQLPYEDLGFAKVDHWRSYTQGFPEVIFGLGKTPEQIAAIFYQLAQKSNLVLATRCSHEAYAAVIRQVPEAQFHAVAGIISLGLPPDGSSSVGSSSDDSSSKVSMGETASIAVLSAGTADLPVAEEAVISAQAMGCQVHRIYDVGVAGIHRLIAHRSQLRQAHVLIVVAGMEGALASVVAGMVDVPVIAVPTSIGYGASFGGLAALLGMLNSCALGVGVVNIDNGFGAAALAATIMRQRQR
ncbi:nickel pincer cofactor biosynthesis protein LarB [Heliophilum fasciatum]|uniref:nickel pincer cofactor biosynthesis protein LarB n=1 Tax=Heliophilum fasciatum TaxID=35700 RepID=UPI0010521209|nr:nickel pincer cofactor biosynthesis protein LarB [Heliophilum fasciatum]